MHTLVLVIMRMLNEININMHFMMLAMAMLGVQLMCLIDKCNVIQCNVSYFW